MSKITSFFAWPAVGLLKVKRVGRELIAQNCRQVHRGTWDRCDQSRAHRALSEGRVPAQLAMQRNIHVAAMKLTC